MISKKHLSQRALNGMRPSYFGTNVSFPKQQARFREPTILSFIIGSSFGKGLNTFSVERKEVMAAILGYFCRKHFTTEPCTDWCRLATIAWLISNVG